MLRYCASASGRLAAAAARGGRVVRFRSDTTSRADHSCAHARVPLTSRGVVAVRGPDARKLIQGLVSNDMRKLASPHDAIFAAFLNQKGRTLFEAIITMAGGDRAASHHPTFLLDVDRKQAAVVAKHLTKFKLASKAEVADLSESLAVHALVPTEPFALCRDARGATDHTANLLLNVRRGVSALGSAPSSVGAAFLDPRAPGHLGARTIFPAALQLDALAMPTASLREYDALRMLHGVPEGEEVVDVMPLEWNVELLHGVAFDKGCYVGQELVARTHFRGLVRKRFVPVYFTGGGSPARPAVCSDALAASLARRTESAAQQRLVNAGGSGHGQGHGPCQSHDTPVEVAPGHAASRSSKIQPTSVAAVDPSSKEARAHSGGSDVLGPDAPTGLIRMPFPWLDLHWRGAVDLGTSLAGQSPEEGGERVGKVVGWKPGSNIGLALVRLEHLTHTLAPASASASEAEGADGAAAVTAATTGQLDAAAAELGDRQQAFVEAQRAKKEALAAAELAGDFSDAAVAGAFQALHARAASKPVDIKVAVGSAGADAASHNTQAAHGHAYRVMPVLPPMWRFVQNPAPEEGAPASL